MPATPSDAMLHRVMAETQRALNTLDPAGRADIIARFVQPYSGWALRWAMRTAGRTAWPGPPSPAHWTGLLTVLRQMRAGGARLRAPARTLAVHQEL